MFCITPHSSSLTPHASYPLTVLPSHCLTLSLSYPLTVLPSYCLTLPAAFLSKWRDLLRLRRIRLPALLLSYPLTLLLSYPLTLLLSYPSAQYSAPQLGYNGVLKQSYEAILYTLTIDKAGVWGDDKSRIRYAVGVGPEHSTGRRKPGNPSQGESGPGHRPVQSVRKDDQPDPRLQRLYRPGDRKLILSPAVIKTKRPCRTAGPFCIYLLIIIRHKNIKKNYNDEKIVKKCPYICLHIKAETNIFIILNA